MILGASQTPPVRVLSVPAGHDYVRHALGPTAAVEVLPDPVLDPTEPDRWWPHPVLEAAENPAVLDGADLVHVHFGYEHRTPDQIARFVDAVRSRGLPLVVTVHDLTNPHEADASAHLERTGHLVRGADAVITLTAGAAAEIHRRWGVEAHVIPHPRLLPRELTDPHRERRRALPGAHPGVDVPRTIGVMLGSLRAGIAAEELLPPLVAALPEGVRLVVMVRADALEAARDPDHPRHAAAEAVDRAAATGRGSATSTGPDSPAPTRQVSPAPVARRTAAVEVRAHEHLTEADLCETVAGFGALILPHRHGTHSGWLELCRDLGVPPVIPDIGYLTEQWGAPAVTYDAAAPTGAGLHEAVRAALASPPVHPRAAAAEDPAVAAAHLALYESVAQRRTTVDDLNR